MSLLYALTCDNLLGGVIGYSGHVFRSFDLKNKGNELCDSFRQVIDVYVPWPER